MSAVATVVNIDNTAKGFIAAGKIALSGNYGTGSSHGDTLDLSKLGVPSQQVPLVLIFEAPDAGDVRTDYRFTYCPGTTQANGLLNVILGSTGAEYTQGSAYDSNFPNDLFFMAFFPSFI